MVYMTSEMPFAANGTDYLLPLVPEAGIAIHLYGVLNNQSGRILNGPGSGGVIVARAVAR